MSTRLTPRLQLHTLPALSAITITKYFPVIGASVVGKYAENYNDFFLKLQSAYW